MKLRFDLGKVSRILVALVLTSACAFPANLSHAQPLTAADPEVARKERDTDRQHLRQIYQAIQAYRGKHGDLPGYLSDLFPDFLSDTNVLLSPVELRTGESRLYGYGDPKMRTSYIYEFSSVQAGGVRDRSIPLTMNQWKSQQMEEFGPVIPILRCHLQDPILNVSYSGDLYETALYWETDPNTFALMAKLGPGPGVKDGKRFRVSVLDATNSKPIAGAEIKATGRQSEFGPLPPRSYTTDDQGQAEVSLGGQQVQGLTLQVSKAGYANLKMQWKDGNIPGDWTAQLPKASKVGGIVKSEAGRPISGATVVVSGTRRDAVGQVLLVEFDALTTDGAGKWETPRVPAGFEQLNFKVSHPEFLPVEYDQATADNQTGNVVTKSALAGGKAEMVMPPGFVVEGAVQGPQGQGLTDALVTYATGENLERRKQLRSDGAGRFRLVTLDSGEAHLVVQAEGFAPAHQRVEVDRELKPLKFSLTKAKPHRGRVLDQAGKPIAEASLSVASWLELPLLAWQTKTDAEGWFTWEAAPTEAFSLTAVRDGYDTGAQEVNSPGDTETTIRLTQTFQLTGKVVDAQTQQPIKSFRILRGYSWGGDDAQVTWENRRPVPGTDGAYTVKLDYRRGGQAKFMAVAEGYLPQATPAYPESGWHTFDFELKQGSGPKGQVVRPGGEPVAGAQVAVLGVGYLSLGKGELLNRGGDTLTAKTDAQGQFSLPAMIASPTLVAVHEAGYGEAIADQLAATGKLVLQPWGKVEGIMKLGRKLATNEQLMLTTRGYGPGGLNYDWEAFRTQTDGEGRFSLNYVPPGERQLVRLIQTSPRSWTHSHVFRFSVKTGEVTQVAYGGTGRLLLGKVAPSNPDYKVEWNRGHHSLHTKPPAPPRRFEKPEEWTAWQSTPEVKAARENSRYFSVQFQPDGSFSIEDIPAGQYVLNMNFTDAGPSDEPAGGQSIGTISKEVEVPQGSDEPLNLGELKLQLRLPLSVGAPAPSFEVRTLEDQPLKLADYKGKFVLLDFWAAWCGPCVAELPHLKAAYEAFAKDARVVFISLSLDPERKDAVEFVKRHEVKWVQGFLGDWSKTELPTAYGVEGIPAAFLIGPDGKLVAKGLRGPAVRAAIEAALEVQ